MTTAPVRTFLPLAESPLLAAQQAASEYADLAVNLAETAAPDLATLRSLLSITRSDVAERIAQAFDERTDLGPDALAVLVAQRPDLKKATSRLKNHLFPDGAGCHRFTRTMAALAHRPENIDEYFLSTDRFHTAAGAADESALHDLLGPLLSSARLAESADAGLAALLAARPVTSPLSLAADAARERTRLGHLREALVARREQTISEIAQHTGGLTLAATTWYDAVTAAADTSEQAERALALVGLAGAALGAGEDPECTWPAVQARWHQVTAAARTARSHPDVWTRAWTAAETTEDGSLWDPTQRALVAGYDLLATHVRTACADRETPPTPTQCWAMDPAGRALIHVIADHLTGHDGHSPLSHFDDALLISFIRGLAKNRRDKIPGGLQISGLVAAVKAARSKAHLLTHPTTQNIGIVIPTRDEAHRIRPSGPGAEDGENALATKVAQLAWLLEARPDAHAQILLVDEDPDGASAGAAAGISASHPQIQLTIATRSEPGTSVKGGAVLWGLAQLLDAGHTTLAYTDLDLTYPLDQLGLLLATLDHPGTGAAIGSRRLAGSHGYYPPAGPTRETRLYQEVVNELLDLDVTDPQAGFKAFTSPAVRTALPLVADRRLSFDTELLAVLQRAGHTVAEVGVAALHHYVDGRVGTPRDYDTMLAAVHLQAVRHGFDPEARSTRMWDKVRAAGSLAAAAQPQPVDLTFSTTPL
ncbi:hypothetical protein ACGFMM_27835 [Streptomyces sp. NPDC048604]|uniref:hypothetical protein n=1 Tax=Streptomyces sp. NPDC048604 TaxID=3365578 RepID=UPI003719E3CA